MKKVSKQIKSLLINALTRDEWYFFENPNLVPCWEEMKCDNSNCPSYESENLRCWQISGTFCEGRLQGEFAKKFGDCQKCRVYKKAIEKDVVFQIGEDFNNLMFHLKLKEDSLRNSILTSEEKNRKLLSLNRKVNRLVKQLDAKNTQLRDLSVKDGLTGLYNYRYFSTTLQDQYNQARRYSYPLSLIMIDIDYFKAVNDTYGHQFGDTVLIQLASILANHIRDTDIVARYGGEEFVIILPHTDLDDAYRLAEKLRKLASSHVFTVKDKALSITISLGLSAYPDDKKTIKAESLVNYADKALYQAKEKGRNQTIVYTEKAPVKKKSRAGKAESMVDRRQHPRVRTLIKIKGEINKRELPFSNAFDISYSGLSLISNRPVDSNKILTITLYLYADENRTKPKELCLDGQVVRCEEIFGYPETSSRSSNESVRYLIGVHFRPLSKKDSLTLQKYFVSLFNRSSLK